ncbi:MAG TPA: NADPH-dependent F420 reductase [Caulobacteraceae bacterium]|nr:NADPH-dependent F420 reductase [Caulobacteraceae bacterium]
MLTDKTIAVIGGTGKLGAALAGRWRAAGLTVVIGSRSGVAYADAAAAADIIVVTVPYAAQADALAQIAPHAVGKLVLDTTVPLVPPRVMRVQLPAEGSAAQRALAMLGEGVRVISGFHSVAAHKLAEPGAVDCDCLVFGDERADRAVGVALAEAAGLRALHGGGLANSAAAEALTSVLIFLNRTYQSDGAGLRITNLPGVADPAA